MLHWVVILAAEAAHEETSKTVFYVFAGLLASWAVVLSFLGLRTAEFPGNAGGARVVMGVSAALVVATMAASVLTG